MKLCGFDIGLDRPFFLIAGPCVVESEQLQMDTAGTLDGILFPLVGATAGVTLFVQPLATSALSDGNPKYSGTGHLEGYTPLGGSYGDLRTTTVTFRSGSALTRTTS